MNKYSGEFDNRLDVARNFNEGVGQRYEGEFTPNENFPAEEDILVASYAAGNYDGAAFVLFRKGDKLYEVNGSHCSCFGLEDQWEPEETTLDAITMRKKAYGMTDEAWDLVQKLAAEPHTVGT